MESMEFKIIRNDDIPAFGGWKAGSLQAGEPVILLNVLATFHPSPVDTHGEPVEMDAEERRYLMIETLMHEFGHALQEYFGLEFSEDRIEEIVEGYRRTLCGDDENRISTA